MITFEPIHPDFTEEMAGLLPLIFSTSDPRPAIEQINDRYSHGGGFTPLRKFTLNAKTFALTYPGDPPMNPIARAELSDKETLYLYPHSFILIFRPGDAWDVCRMD